jgi:hypothetical protein
MVDDQRSCPRKRKRTGRRKCAGGITGKFQVISRTGGEIEDPRRYLT